MAKRASGKAPAWLAAKGIQPGKQQASEDARSAAESARVIDIAGAIEGKDARPVVVAEHPKAVLENRLQAVQAAQNPIIEAARPLLRAICDLPEDRLKRREVDYLRALLVRELETFETLCYRANIERKHVVAASYCLCCALDEAAHHTKWGCGGKTGLGAWSERVLASQFHGDRDGGTKVHQLLERLAEDPDANLHVIHLIYDLLSLGFMGRYRLETHGDWQIEHVRAKLHAMLETRLPRAPRALSNALANVSTVKNFKPMRGIPVRGTVVICFLLLLGQFAWYRYILDKRQQEALRSLEAIDHLLSQPLALPPVPVSQGKERGKEGGGQPR